MRSYLNNVVSFLASPGLTDTTSAAKKQHRLQTVSRAHEAPQVGR
jgi:hypothetical protein